MANLLESYKNRLAISESVYQKSHNGSRMPSQKKLLIAAVLDNTSKFLNESFDNAAATQRSTLGDYKRFCLNVSTVALPNLILPELMLTQPMSSIAGYITYLRYTAGTAKGGVNEGDLFNGVYRMGPMTEDRTRYTSSAISESHTVTAADASAHNFVLDWAPVVDLKSVKIDTTVYTVADTAVADTSVVLDKAAGTITFASDDTKFVANAVVKALYVYDNVVIPQTNTPTSLPTLTAQMEAIELHAHARRIAVYYSQIAAFQAKNDYGFDMGQQLAAQAQGELAYEIDSEGVKMLYDGAELDAQLQFAKYKDDKAIGRTQYYEAFSEIIARAKAIIYTRTQKFAPNYMICGANVLTILPYLKGWTPAPAAVVNGPYFAGTVDSLKVFVSPTLPVDDFVFGVNGSDLQTAAAVYAPYMAIVPTQLLGFADGTMSQGFSTMYDMKLLSTYNVVDNVKVDAKDGKYSWLLVKGSLLDADTYLNVKCY